MMSGIIGVIFYLVLLAGSIYLLIRAAHYMTAKINAVRGDERVCEKEVALVGLDIAEKAIKTVAEASVGKLEELIAKELRPKVKNGGADVSELHALAEEAYYEVINTVQPEVLQALSGSLRNVDLYIRNQVEHQLRLLKAQLNGGASNEKMG